MNRFPRGKLKDDDEGELEVSIGILDSAVVINFGKPITWIGLGVEEARGLAELLLKHASELEGQNRPLASDGKQYCARHRVPWDEQQAEEGDECVDCGRTRPQHRQHVMEELGKRGQELTDQLLADSGVKKVT